MQTVAWSTGLGSFVRQGKRNTDVVSGITAKASNISKLELKSAKAALSGKIKTEVQQWWI